MIDECTLVEFDKNPPDTTSAVDDPTQPTSAWTFDDIVCALRFISVPTNTPIAGFSIDSRTITPGQVFIALSGARVDGHDFVAQACERGAQLAIVERAKAFPELSSYSHIKVDSTHAALMDLAQYARARTAATIVGVSGSVGKTTVREWIAALLAHAGDTVSTRCNHNGKIGLPLSITQLAADTRFGVFEIGIDEPDSMQVLAALCNPHIAVMTPITCAHIENFKSLDSLAHEKAMLFSGLCSGGVVVVDQETYKLFPVIKHVAEEFGAIDVVTVGNNNASVQIASAVVDGNQTHVVLRVCGVTFEYTIRAVGEHFVQDSAIALASAMCAAYDGTLQHIVGEHAQVITDVFLPVMSSLAPLPGRGQVRTLMLDGARQVQLVDDAYNANLASMLAGMRAFASMQAPRKIAVVGDMLALGKTTRDAHAQLFDALSESDFDKVYALGEFVQEPFEAMPKGKRGALASSLNELERLLLRDLRDGDAVWVKASHAIGLHELFARLSVQDRDVAA
ncbi:MAG: UDP-N-acetylmuramoyl-tripeptide--D-alanyl-D-alanine ligase [Holosporales bacterium]|jgi:UDP-N-acetylmuramoyl-tripeptide--D-alanyl-D-alanine ligase|nr:UDP-N-acetylmuramoyl-tripeptide--D-alanyl-D-alanine ligase [Holosporales bacterium]